MAIETQYTSWSDPRVDTEIGSILTSIVREICHNVPDTVAAVLDGGFGKGEGSIVKIGNRILPLNDFDILVVTRKPHLNFKSPIKMDSSGRDFHVDIVVLWKPLLRLVGKKLQWYDFKFGSKILYGDRSVLDTIPLQRPDEIPTAEAVRLQFFRMMGLIEFFDPNLGRRVCSASPVSERLVYQSVKAILACCESLLLLRRKWLLKSASRCDLFKRIFFDEFGELASKDRSLPDDVGAATHFKLFPSYSVFPDALELWFRARGHLLNTIDFCWGNSLRAFPEDFANRTHGVLSALNFLMYHARYFSERRRMSARAFLLGRRIWGVLFATAYLMLDSINTDGEIDPDRLKMARKLLCRLCTLKDTGTLDRSYEWRYLRDRLFEAHNYLR